MSRVMRKPGFCIWENKDADQLRGNREADQRLCSQVSYRFLALGCFPANLVSDVVCVLFVLRVGSLKG